MSIFIMSSVDNVRLQVSHWTVFMWSTNCLMSVQRASVQCRTVFCVSCPLTVKKAAYLGLMGMWSGCPKSSRALTTRSCRTRSNFSSYRCVWVDDSVQSCGSGDSFSRLSCVCLTDVFCLYRPVEDTNWMMV